MDKWNYDKRVRELSQEIEQYKIHAKREIENNKLSKYDFKTKN